MRPVTVWLFTRVAVEKALPFDPLVPNAETIAAMRDVLQGKVESFKSIEALMEDLDKPD